MAAAGSVECDPSMVDQWGPYARSVSGLHRLPKMSPWPGLAGAGREPGDRPWVRMADARSLPRLDRLREVWLWERDSTPPLFFRGQCGGVQRKGIYKRANCTLLV